MTLALDPYSWRYILRALLALLFFVAVMAIVARANEALGPSGEGAGAASGYVVREIEYSLLASDPTRVDGVTFNMIAAEGSSVPGKVTVSVDDGARWMVCTPLRGSGWTCPIHVPLRDLTSLRVVAAQ
jgi:hypothetical protein